VTSQSAAVLDLSTRPVITSNLQGAWRCQWRQCRFRVTAKADLGDSVAFSKGGVAGETNATRVIARASFGQRRQLTTWWFPTRGSATQRGGDAHGSF